MLGIIICLIAVMAAFAFLIGYEEPRKRVREVGLYLLCLDLFIIGLVVANVLPGGRP